MLKIYLPFLALLYCGVSAQRWDLLLRDAVLFVRLPLPTSAAFMCEFSHLSLESVSEV